MPPNVRLIPPSPFLEKVECACIGNQPFLLFFFFLIDYMTENPLMQFHGFQVVTIIIIIDWSFLLL